MATSNINIALRLSGPQARLILPGLARVINSHAVRAVYGGVADQDPELRWARPGYDGGRYDRLAMAFLITAHQALCRLGPGGGRLRLNYFQIAGLAFAARVTAMRLRHGHLAPWRPAWRSASARLLHRLEVLEKRSRRAYIKARGQEDYNDVHARWICHLRWLRTHFLYCGCGRTRCGGMRKYYQRVIGVCVGQAREGLTRRGFCPPDDRQLRRLVRCALAAIRRGRAPGLSLRALLQNAPHADTDLADFILKRCRLSPLPGTSN